MFKAIPYFVFQDANAAIAYYEMHFDAKVISKANAAGPEFEDMPMPGVDKEDFVMHAALEIMGQTFFISSSWGNKETPNNDTSVALVFDENNEEVVRRARKFFDKASSTADNIQPFGEAPWTKYFGSFTDKYGVNWMLSGE